MAEAAQKLNTFARSIEYIDTPLHTYKMDLWGDDIDDQTCAAAIIYGLIYSLSNTKKNPDGSVWVSYQDIHEITEYWFSAISDALKRLEDHGIIEQDKSNRSHTRYRIKKEIECGGFIRLDAALFGIIEAEYGNFHFTRTEKLILCFMVGMAMREKAEGKYNGSHATVGKVVNCHPETARLAINKIMHAGLFHRPKESKGTCAKNPSEYIIDTKLLLEYGKVRKQRKAEAIERERRAKESRSAEAAPVLMPASAFDTPIIPPGYDEYFNRIRGEEDERVKKIRGILSRDTVYGPADKKRLELNLDKFRAVARGDRESFQRLTIDINEQETIISSRLKELGISPDELEYHRKCKLCEDSGYLPNGRPCSCYPRWQRGRPR